jgi:hypothetical protein
MHTFSSHLSLNPVMQLNKFISFSIFSVLAASCGHAAVVRRQNCTAADNAQCQTICGAAGFSEGFCFDSSYVNHLISSPANGILTGFVRLQTCECCSSWEFQFHDRFDADYLLFVVGVQCISGFPFRKEVSARFKWLWYPQCVRQTGRHWYERVRVVITGLFTSGEQQNDEW